MHAIGDWGKGAVVVRAVKGSRRAVGEVEALIEEAWEGVRRRPGVKLFDGPMCRMEELRVDGGMLEIGLSETSYKPFMGTNLAHPELVERYGSEVMANPVGVSSAVESADGRTVNGGLLRRLRRGRPHAHPPSHRIRWGS